MPDVQRLLPVKRISRDDDASSSLEVQDRSLNDYIETHPEDEVAGWVVDDTVSGSINLADRKSLGQWMVPPKVFEWDVMVVKWQDRIVRDDVEWGHFVWWCHKNDKDIVILDDPSFDMHSITGRMIANIKAGQAAEYRQQVVIKRTDAAEFLRTEGLWNGGSWPYGYRTERVTGPDGKRHWRLVLDEFSASHIRECWHRVVNEGWTLERLCWDAMDRVLLTPRDYQRHVEAERGREDVVSTKLRHSKWWPQTMHNVLTNPALMGYQVRDKKIVMKDGLPIQVAEAVLSPVEFQQLQQALDKKGSPWKGSRKNRHPLYNVLWCRCGKKFTTANRPNGIDQDKRIYSNFHCSSINDRRNGKCQYFHSFRTNEVYDFLDESFLDTLGDLEVTKRVFIPGQNRSSEIDDLKYAMKNLGEAIGNADNSIVIQTLTDKMTEYADRLAELEAQPVIESRWEETGTGKFFRDHWQAMSDWKERGDFLRDLGVRMYASWPREFHLYLPEALQDRVRDVLGSTQEPGWQAEWLATVEQDMKDGIRA